MSAHYTEVNFHVLPRRALPLLFLILTKSDFISPVAEAIARVTKVGFFFPQPHLSITTSNLVLNVSPWGEEMAQQLRVLTVLVLFPVTQVAKFTATCSPSSRGADSSGLRRHQRSCACTHIHTRAHTHTHTTEKRISVSEKVEIDLKCITCVSLTEYLRWDPE